MVDTAATEQDRRHIIDGRGSNLLKFDFYGQGFSMKIDRDLMNLPTWAGTFCSILTFVIIASYAV